MTPELTFKLASNFAIIGWLLLAGLPNARVTKLLVRNGVWPLILSGLYLLILALYARGGFDFGSLEGVNKLFSNPWVYSLDGFTILHSTFLLGFGKRRKRKRWEFPDGY